MDNTGTNITKIIQHLKAVSRALNQLETKGRQNLEILLGSIQEIDQAATSLEISLREMDPPAMKLEVVQNPPQDEEPEVQPE